MAPLFNDSAKFRNLNMQQVDMAFEVFERNDLIFDDWYQITQRDDCLNDPIPSCKEEWP